MINHQDNFITSLTSGISAGATTAPLASIPTIDAPFYLAFDATNLNGNYEIRMVSSKTATNVNFLACSFPHSADEEVRMVIPSWEADKIYQAPQGFLLNGKIVPSVTSNNLTVALKTLAGTDPSALNPVHIRIGDTVRTITSALSTEAEAGQNWFNAGSAELATKEIDYFVYLGYNTTDGVFIGFSRIPYATSGADVSGLVSSEKLLASNWTTARDINSTLENIGRFSATLSAGVGHTWSVPTFTVDNLRQVPTFDTRWLSWNPAYTWNGSAPSGSPTKNEKYKIIGKQLFVNVFNYNYSSGSSNTQATISAPMAVISGIAPAVGYASTNNTVNSGAGYITGSTLSLFFSSVSAERILLMTNYEI
jgi:hypothetical protein